MKDPRIIFMLPIDDCRELEEYKKLFKDGETLMVSRDTPILIKDRDGFWKEVKK